MSEGLAVSLSPARLVADPGGSAQVTLQVQNRSGVVDEYVVEVLGDAAAWTVLDRSRVPVFPDGVESVQATIRPPREPFPAAGDVAVGFRVRSSVDPQVSVVEECHLDLKAFVEIGSEIRPKTAKGRFSATHHLRLINRGNAPVSVSVRAEVQQGDVEVEVPPAPVVVGAGARMTTKVKVKPSGSHWSGGDEMHSYRFNLMPQGGSPVAIDAMMRQRPIAQIPTALLVAAALFLGGAYVVYGRGPNPIQQAIHWGGSVDTFSPSSPSSSGQTGAPPSSSQSQSSGQASTPPSASPAGPTPPVPSPSPTVCPIQNFIPPMVQVTATPGNSQVTLSWPAPPAQNNVTGYLITYSPSSGSETLPAGTTSTVIVNLTNGTTYTFNLTEMTPCIKYRGSVQATPNGIAVLCQPLTSATFTVNSTHLLTWAGNATCASGPYTGTITATYVRTVCILINDCQPVFSTATFHVTGVSGTYQDSSLLKATYKLTLSDSQGHSVTVNATVV